MAKFCPSCGAESPDQFTYCGFCAHLLETPPTAETSPKTAVGTRTSLRLATILFADLTNFTRAAAKADPEEIYLIIRATLEQLAQSVYKLGGHIDRYVGDGFLATFGVPEAHEDDARRALLAGLEMQQSMVNLRAKASQKVNWDAQLRIGVHVGPVVSGQLDTGPLFDSSVFGHTVNLANRLQGAARPGTILVSEAVHRHTRTHFNFLEAVKLQLKGIDGPVIGYEVVGRRTDPEPIRGLSGRSTPLVGRSAEYELLRSTIQRLQVDHRGAIVLITGEAGIGKSRLVREALPSASEPVTVVHCECSPTEASSYQLLKETLSALVGITPEQSPAERRQQIYDLLSASANLAREIGPTINRLLGGWEEGDELAADPKQEQRRIFVAARRLLGWLARRRPVMLVLDDLHWADQSSIEVLAHLASLVNDAPLAVVCIARTSARDMLLASVGTASDVRANNTLDIQLQSLSLTESRNLLGLLLPRIPLPPALLQNIVERAIGVPLLIEEIVRMLLDHGIFWETPEGWRVDASWSEVVHNVPDTVNGLILNRYDRLPADLKRILDVAAVFGRSFSLPELMAMTHLPETELRAQLESLEQADFIRRSYSAHTSHYSFRHPLMREAIYQTMLQSQRRALHLEAAQVIQQIGSGTVQDSLSQIAHHLEQGESPLAKAFLFQAASRAATQYANQEAIGYYTRLAALTDDEANGQDAIDIALGLGELLARTNQLEPARAELEKAEQLAMKASSNGYRLGDVYYLQGLFYANQGQYDEAVGWFHQAANVLHQSPEDCRNFGPSDIERELGWVRCNQFKLDAAEQHARQALALAAKQANQAAVGSAHNLLAAVHFYGGHLAESVASAQEALAIRERMDDLWGAASAQSNLGTLYYKLGQWSKAEAYLRQAIFVQQEVGDYHTLSISWNTLGLLLMELGRFDEALQALDQALTTIGSHADLPALASGYQLNRGLVYLRMGRLEEAVVELERSLAARSQSGNDRNRTHALTLLAEAHLALGNVGEAKVLLRQAQAIEEEGPSEENRAEILRVQSYIAKVEHLWDEALEANRRARNIVEELGNRCEVARRQVELGEIHLARQEAGDDREAAPQVITELLAALRFFRELHAEADVARAEQTLARLEVSRARPAERWPSSQQVVVVVNIHLRLATMQHSPLEQTPHLTEALEPLVARLRQIGNEYGATAASTRSGLAFVFSFADAEHSQSVSARPVQCAVAAIDSAAQINSTNRCQHNVAAVISIGIAAGRWQSAIRDPEEAALFISVSQIGRQAESLAQLSSANQVLLTGEIVEAARRVYDLESVEYPRDKRLPRPIYRLGHAKPMVQLAQKIPTSTPQLVGRASELSMLTGCIDRLRVEPQGWVCYLEAEAGMGKSRLVAETLAYAQPDILCLVGKCEPLRSGISFWALVDMLEHAPVPDLPASQRLRSVLGLQPPDLDDELMMRSLPPADLRQEIFGRARDFLLHLAETQPVLLVVEDAHWLDLSSLDLFDYLLPVTQAAPISIMFVARAEMPGPHRSLIGKAERMCRERYIPIAFAGLTVEESLTLARQLLHAAALPAPLAEMLAAFAGHPLSVEEALRYLIEAGQLWLSDGQWLLTDVELAARHRLPPTYKDLLLARLEALDSETLHVLQAAAVLGETLDRSVLSSIVPDSMLSQRLSELVERGWLIGPPPAAPMRYNFKHTLTRETIYATLLASKRQLLHRRTAEAIERLHAEAVEEYVELLALHCGQGGLRDKFLHYGLRAAEKSLARYALAESLGYYQQAKETLLSMPRAQRSLLPQIEIGLADVRLARGDPGTVINDLRALLDNKEFMLPADVHGAVLRRVGTALRQTGKLQSAWDHYQKARSLLRSWTDSQSQVSVAAMSRPNRELYGTELDLAHTLFDMHNIEAAKEQSDDVLERVDRRLFPDLAAQALNLKGGIAHRQHDTEMAVRMVADSLAIYQATGNRIGAAAAYSNLGILCVSQNQFEQAEDHFNLSLALREALGDIHGLAITHNNLGQLNARRGRWAHASQHLQQAIELARTSEQSYLLAQSQANLGYVLNLLDQTDEALNALADCERISIEFQFRDLLCESLWKRAECLAERGEYELAATFSLQSIQLAEELVSSDLKSDAQRTLSRAYRNLNRNIEALQAAAAAWKARSGDADPLLRARFAAEYGLALIACGYLDDAKRLFQQHVVSAKLLSSSSYQQEVSTALIESV